MGKIKELKCKGQALQGTNVAAAQEQNQSATNGGLEGRASSSIRDEIATPEGNAMLKELRMRSEAATPSKLPLTLNQIERVREGFLLGKFQNLCDQALLAIAQEQRIAKLERENAELKLRIK